MAAAGVRSTRGPAPRSTFSRPVIPSIVKRVSPLLQRWATWYASAPSAWCSEPRSSGPPSSALKQSEFATAFSTNKDIESQVSDAWRLYMLLTTSKKPMVSGAFTEHGVPRMRDMMQLFRHDRAELIAKPLSIFTITATGNFRYGEDSCQNMLDCVEAGIDWIMHADFMDERQADRLAASGIPCCPALTFTANIVDWGHIAGCSQARIDRFRRDLDKAVKNLSYAHRNGVKMMCGTDTGFAVTPYGEWHAREPELFVKLLGMSPLEAITCATRNSAVTVDGGNLGTLETGKLADLLVVDGDPLAEIRILQDRERLHAIYLGGQAIDRTPQPPMHRWPWERSLQISEREIYQSTVREHAAA